MKDESFIPAQSGWCAVTVRFSDNGVVEIGNECDVIGWYVFPIRNQFQVVDGFSTYPVTVDGDLTGEFFVVRSPSKKFYSPKASGSFESLAEIIEQVQRNYVVKERKAP